MLWADSLFSPVRLNASDIVELMLVRVIRFGLWCLYCMNSGVSGVIVSGGIFLVPFLRWLR